MLQVDGLFRINHTDPWVKGDPYRTSRTISIQNTRQSGNAVHGRAPDDFVRQAHPESSSLEHWHIAFVNGVAVCTSLLWYMYIHRVYQGEWQDGERR